MQDGITVDTEGFSRDVAQFALLTGRSFADELKTQAKGALREIIADTPPFGNRSRGVSDAKKASEGAIGRDMHRIFRPKKLTGSRSITHLFGKQVRGAPWTRPAREKHPDLGSLLAAHKRLSSSGRQARYRNAYFVDAAKYFDLLKQKQKRGGYLGAGFAAAAVEMGINLPHFMKRHSGSAPGRVQVRLTGDEMFIIIMNDVPYASQVYGFPRRVEAALQTQRGKMERQLPHLIRRHERLIN